MTNILGRLCGLHLLAYMLVLIGALNWGLVAIGGYTGMNLNIVNILLGTWSMIERFVYLLVGLSGVVLLFQPSCTMCDEGHIDLHSVNTRI